MLRTLLSRGIPCAVLALSIHLPASVAEFRNAASRAAARPLTARHLSPRRSSADTLRTQARLALPPITPHLQELLNQPGIEPHHRELSASVLGLLTPNCQSRLQTFSVLYDNPKHRGLAGRGVIILSGNVPNKEFIGLLLHEGLGHFRDITCIMGNPGSGASEFRDGSAAIWNDDPSVLFYRISWRNEKERKRDAKREDFVTGYAYETDNFEDLAEAATYYMTQEKAFRARAAGNPTLSAKLSWLETYMPKTATFAASGNAWDGKIAWDATKLSFHLSGRQE